MTKTQWYIGAPNGVVVCADSRTAAGISGRLYHSYRTDEQTFGDFEQMVSLMEELFNALNFPHPGTNERSFTPVQKTGEHYTERQKVMKDESLLNKHGDLGTFIIRVQHRQNSSWQGRITWMEQDKTINFRSVWEMVKLIESAVETTGKPDEGEETASW